MLQSTTFLSRIALVFEDSSKATVDVEVFLLTFSGLGRYWVGVGGEEITVCTTEL